MSLYSLDDVYLYNNGELLHSYNLLGAHRIKYQGVFGVRFMVWAPNALRVNVVGDFNNWESNLNKMDKINDTGVWVAFIEGAKEGDLYKYEIVTEDKAFLKADPYAFYSEVRPKTASSIYNLQGYKWKDNKWIENKKTKDQLKQPINIYEVHLGSWRKKEDDTFYTYAEIAEQLIEYVTDMGYTHIEILPLMEFPYDGSWGYQTIGYYSATSRYGEPKLLMELVDKCHQKGIGVILDWVPGHFCKDQNGLYEFDGTNIYGVNHHKQWGTMNFDFEKTEVQNFLMSNALFWLEMFHFDGLRVDGVTSMINLNFGYDNNEDSPKNEFGGYQNIRAINFIKRLNENVFREYPDVLMMAEESSAWPLVTGPTYDNGLGFNYKWDMGWMNDTLKYMELDPADRKYNHNLITFSMAYTFSENFVLPLSHDEAVHGKKSLISKMPGDYNEKFANLRLLFAYMILHPGKKLMFMGGEFAQFIEWKYSQGLDWLLLDYEMHVKFKGFVKKINKLYLKENSLWQIDHEIDGFEWIDADNSDQSIFIFRRKATRSFVIGVFNFTPVSYKSFRVGVPKFKSYKVIINTDMNEFGGSSEDIQEDIVPSKIKYHNQPYSIEIDVPPLSAQFIKIKYNRKKSNKMK